jgi:signal transduction histidine kinase
MTNTAAVPATAATVPLTWAMMATGRERPAKIAAVRPRIRHRMALIAAIATGTVMLVFCVPLALYVRTNAYDRAVDGAELQARSLAAELAAASRKAGVAHLVHQANSASTAKATAYLSGGVRVGGPMWPSVKVPPAVLAERAVTTVAPDGGRLLWEPVHDPVVAWAVVVRVHPGELTKGVTRTWALLFGGGALLVLLAVALADRLGRSIVRPLQDLVMVTNRLRDGDLTSRARASGPHEVAEVGGAVNDLAARIDGLLESARLAAADLGHRLRTPLTALRLDAEAMADESLSGDAARTRLQADLDGLERAVDQLIKQARSAPEQASARSDLAAAARDRLAFWSVLAKAQGRTADVHLPSCRVEVGLGREELEAAIDALLSNVFLHTPEGTSFSVTLSRTGDGQQPWSFVVANAGPIPASQPAADASAAPTESSHSARNRGTGLGLDIVRRTAERAGGTFTAGPSGTGGFRALLTVPRRSPDNAE